MSSRVAIEYHVTIQDLKRLEGNGNISMRATEINVENLAVWLEGNSFAVLAGNAIHQEVLLNGNSHYESEDLAGREGQFDLNGNSEALVNVSDLLNADLSGNSILEYIGDPKITQRVDGSSQLKQH